MNLGEAKNLAKLLYFSNTPDNRVDLDDIQLTALINVANKYRWQQAAERFMSLFTTQGADRSVAASGDDISAISAPDSNYDAGVFFISCVDWKKDGNYYRLPYIQIVDLDQYQTNVSLGDVEPAGWTIFGETVKLVPTQVASKTVRYTYVPPLADLTTDASSLLAGKMKQFHQLVVYDAISPMIPPAQTGFFGAQRRYEMMWDEHMKSRQRGGRNIRYIPYG